jgi:hypothetical protein
VPKPTFGGPFHKSDLSDDFGQSPDELAHLFRKNPAAPSRAACREIGKGATLHAKRLQVPAKLSSEVRGKAGAYLAGEFELLALEIPNYRRINTALTVRPESADHELLLVFELEFQPIFRPLPGLIRGAATLRYYTFEVE